MPLVAVAPHRRAYGVGSDCDDWRYEPGHDRNARRMRDGSLGVACAYEVQDLTTALEREYRRSDAHLVPYVVRDPRGGSAARQPRVNKAGLPYVLSLGYTITIEVLLADVDNPGHVPWTNELRAQAREVDRQIPGVGVYYSAHGRRLVQPLERPIVVDGSDDAELRISAWLASLRALGVVVDTSCADWTRHYRLPHVRRDGRFVRSELVDLSRMVPAPPPEPAGGIIDRRRKPRATLELARAGDVDAAPLARAFELAGLLGPRLGDDKRAALCPFRASHSVGRDYDTSTVVFGATTSSPRGWWHCSHASCRRRSQGEAIAALPLEARRLVAEETPRRPAPVAERELVTTDEARVRLQEAFRRAPDGLSVVVAGCGVGKTEAAIVVASERAAAPGGGKRAPAHSKTAITVPTNALAIEVAERARANGTSVLRLFGPLSARGPDGKPVCAIHACASAFAMGGLSVPWELCEGRGREPCEHAETCSARGGREGPDDARVLVAPHQLIARVSGAIGRTGLLVVDEPPPLLEHELITAAQLLSASEDLGRYFEPRYAAAMAVSLRALAAWVTTGPLNEPGPLSEGVRVVDPLLLEDACHATGATDAVGAAREAFEPSSDPRQRSTSPPVLRSYAFAARRSLTIARAVGRASRVAGIVWQALTCPAGEVVARIEERGAERKLVVTRPDVGLREAMRREGACVVADAGARQHLEVYRLVTGYEPPVTEVHAADGAPVERTHLRRRASRRGWLPAGQLTVDASLVRSIESVARWLAEAPPERWALVTFRALALAIRRGLGDDAEGLRGDWAAAGQAPEALDACVARLRPALHRLPSRPDVGHFGGLRGLDHWRGHDALVTLGDPWPQLGDVRHEGELLRLGDWEHRAEAGARAELEQAHGRLRTVHRSQAARALHVGSVRPGGWDGADVVACDDVGGRRRGAGVSDVREVVRTVGSVREAARALGVDRATVRRRLREA